MHSTLLLELFQSLGTVQEPEPTVLNTMTVAEHAPDVTPLGSFERKVDHSVEVFTGTINDFPDACEFVMRAQTEKAEMSLEAPGSTHSIPLGGEPGHAALASSANDTREIEIIHALIADEFSAPARGDKSRFAIPRPNFDGFRELRRKTRFDSAIRRDPRFAPLY